MRLNFVPVCEVSDAVLERNKAHCDRLGLPRIEESGPVAPNLALIGGGPSVARFVNELANWNGEIWAVNGAYHWCKSLGIEAAFFSISPTETTVPHARGAKKAILGHICSPSLFELLKDADVEVAHFSDELPNGSTGASTAPVIAAWRGHKHVTLYGCECSFEDRTHAYQGSPVLDSRVMVECGGKEYLTTPQFLMQADYLGELAIALPDFIEVRGAGLLPALVEHGSYETVGVSRNLMEDIERETGQRAPFRILNEH